MVRALEAALAGTLVATLAGVATSAPPFDRARALGDEPRQMATMYETILVAEDAGVVTLVVNRPDKLNALNRVVLSELEQAIHAIPETARAVIVTGAGERAFVAGADIAEMSGMPTAEAKKFSDLGHRVCFAIEEARCPFIAAVNGFAFGGGTELALACDFIYASEKAKFGQPEVNLGLMPGFGGTQRLVARVGPGRAREMIYTGDPIDAATALRIGLANAVCAPEELMDRVRAVAVKIASRGPLAVAASKRAILRGALAGLPSGCEVEAQAFSSLFGTEDQREGTRAFLEKRPATFHGR